MLFDFNKYVLELREKEDKKQIVEKYELLHGVVTGTIFEQIWYKEYVNNFQPFEYQVSNLWYDYFDWNLLLQLSASSFSSRNNIHFTSYLPALYISVENEGHIISKYLNELYPFQIDRLYQIYTEEQMNLQNHLTESIIENKKVDDKNTSICSEMDEIYAQREYTLKRFNELLKYIERKKIINETKNELDDLALF